MRIKELSLKLFNNFKFRLAIVVSLFFVQSKIYDLSNNNLKS